MNYERSKKLIGSLALIFVFALSMITITAITANITPAFAQERQQSSSDNSQERQQSSSDNSQEGQPPGSSGYCCVNGGSACRVVYSEYRQAPVCCTRVSIGGGYYPYGYNQYGYRSYYRERKVRSVPW